MRLTVMSYNIKAGLWTEEGIDAVARVIKQTRPDVVALQEVDRHMERSRNIDQASWLGERLGLHAVFARAMPGETFGMPGGEYGIAILSRWPIVEHERMLLHRPTTQSGAGADSKPEQRVALGAAVDIEGQPVDVVCTHLGLSEDERLRQAEDVAGFCAGWHSARPLILMGDFNAFPDADEIATVRKTLVDVFQQHAVAGDERLTFPSGPLGSRAENGWAGAIDYVFVSSQIHPVHIEVLREATPASDHAPVVATLELASG